MATSTIRKDRYNNLSGLNLNDYVETYMGYVYSVTNQPSGRNANGYLVVISDDGDNRCTQFYKPYNSGRIYSRYQANSTWSAWREYSLCYESGDTYSKDATQKHCAGYLTGGGSSAVFTIPLERPVNASSVTFSKLTLTLVADGARLINAVEVVASSSYSVSAVLPSDKSAITVTITPTTAFGHGLMPCDAILSTSTATFS